MLYHSQYGDWSVALLSYPKRMGEWFTILSSASLLLKAMSNEATRSTGTLLYQSLSPYKVTLTGTPYFYMRDRTADHTQIRLPYSCMDFLGCVEHVLYSRYTAGHVQIRRYACLWLVPQTSSEVTKWYISGTPIKWIKPYTAKVRAKICIKKSQVYLVYLYLTCERLANLQNTCSVHVSCVTLHKMAEDVNSDVQLLNSWRKFRIVQICKTFRLQRRDALQGSNFYWYTVSSKTFYYSSAFCFFSGH